MATVNELDIFSAALELSSPEERARFLDEVCGEDRELRRRIEELLRSHAEAAGFMIAPAARPITSDEPIAERAGDLIGPYKLVEEIGEGGFGIVFLAEQQQPVRRIVALKVLKPGLDTRQIIARFEAERQALAIMDHPHIARVYDGGATASGRPYFVMELVKGIPITQYCNQCSLTTGGRLVLFAEVCEAVHHAHQKGIIHRDLKPSNILVAIADGKPIVKVIDFGVAKAINQRLSEHTIVTGFHQMIGTPSYMSPEQAEMSPLEVDTRADIYALGVLLYELLTGTTPYLPSRLEGASYAELRRILWEEEPPLPSSRLSTLKDELPTVAAQRRTEPRQLVRAVKGELDWIVMKCLEKDRNRRYESASSLAMDVERYLRGEAVVAHPPSAAYRLRKFVGRNRGLVLTASLLLAALVGGIIGTSWGLVRAEIAREEAVQARQAEAARAEGERRAKQEAQAREAEIAAMLEFVENRILAATGTLVTGPGPARDVSLRKAVLAALPFIETNFKDRPLVEAGLRITFGNSLVYMGDYQSAAQQLETARAIRARLLGPDHPDTLRSMNSLANCYGEMGRDAEAAKLHEQALAAQSAKLGGDHLDVLATSVNLARDYCHLGRYSDALRVGESALAILQAKWPDHPFTLNCMTALGATYERLHRNADAIRLYEEALAQRKARLGANHPYTLASMHNLADGYSTAGRLADARRLYEQTLELYRATFGLDNPSTLVVMSNLANTYMHLGLNGEALKLFEETLANMKTKLGPKHPNTLMTMHNLAGNYFAVSRHADALKLYEETLTLRCESLGSDHPETLMTRWGLARTLVALNRATEAVSVIDDCWNRAKGKTVDPRLQPGLLGLRMRHFAINKDAAGCRATAQMWEQLSRMDGNGLFAAARFRAVAAAAQANRAGTDTAPLANEDADRAMGWLRLAVAAGFNDIAQLKQNKDLDALRERDDFKMLLVELNASSKN